MYAGTLCTRERLCNPFLDLRLTQLRAGCKHHERLHLLAELTVVDADDSGVGDVGMLDEPVLDLDRVDVLGAAQDHVAHAALDEQHVVVDPAEVTGAVPTARPQNAASVAAGLSQ